MPLSTLSAAEPPPLAVLYFEDDSSWTEIVAEALQAVPTPRFQVTTVSSLAEGLERLRHCAYDAALLDLNLSDSQGTHTYDRLRAVAAELPVIVLTGHDDPGLAAEIIRKGVQEFIPKRDVTPPLLRITVRSAIERHRLLREAETKARQLEQSEARIRILVQTTSDAIVVTDVEGLVRFANPAAEAMFGRPVAELLYRPFGVPAVTGHSIEVDILRTDQTVGVAEMRVSQTLWGDQPAYLASLRDITERKAADAERERLICELQETLANLRVLRGLLPICSGCKRIRDDKGYWNSVEEYVTEHTEAQFTHGLCPDCIKRWYPGLLEKNNLENPQG